VASGGHRYRSRDAAKRLCAGVQPTRRPSGYPSFTEDPVLRAGTCVMGGSWVLMANLRDELSFFSEMFDHGE
jgi:hypothetical protein